MARCDLCVTQQGVLKEITKLLDAPVNRAKLLKASRTYMRVGGFPGVQGLDDPTRVRLLQEYANAVVYRDVAERHEISSMVALRYVMSYRLYNFARNVSVRAVSGVLKQQGVRCRREMLADYIAYFQDAYVAFGVSRRTDSFVVKRAKPDKCYLIDIGLIQALHPKNDAEKGLLLENLVFLALRRGFKRIEYYLTKSGREIDFIVTDDEERTTEDGICIVSAWKWLLQEN